MKVYTSTKVYKIKLPKDVHAITLRDKRSTKKTKFFFPTFYDGNIVDLNYFSPPKDLVEEVGGIDYSKIESGSVAKVELEYNNSENHTISESQSVIGEITVCRDCIAISYGTGHNFKIEKSDIKSITVYE